jgi:hypothetical protein
LAALLLAVVERRGGGISPSNVKPVGDRKFSTRFPTNSLAHKEPLAGSSPTYPRSLSPKQFVASQRSSFRSIFAFIV